MVSGLPTAVGGVSRRAVRRAGREGGQAAREAGARAAHLRRVRPAVLDVCGGVSRRAEGVGVVTASVDSPLADFIDLLREERRVLEQTIAHRDRRIAWLESLLSVANEEIGALREELRRAKETG